tara:strand:- start:260 stop:682 length:423 start_codon:yes stop_codon:yes gene_type:complete
MKLRLVCKEWRTALDVNFKHIFSTRSYPVHLPIANNKDRLFQHKKAKRLGFRHDSAGQGEKRHVTLWHPSGLCCLTLSIKEGVIATTVQHVATLNRSHKKKKKKSSYREPEEAEEGAPECIKCGFRTWRDSCPLCGRPAF